MTMMAVLEFSTSALMLIKMDDDMRVYFYYSKNQRDCAMYIIGKGD